MRKSSRIVSSVAWMVLLVGSRVARGEDAKSLCASNYEIAQTARGNSELIASREALRYCARDFCPTFIKMDCLQWLADVDKSLPSIVLGAHADGRDVYDVKVEMDNKPITEHLDGRAIDVDPGRHVVRFKYASFPAQEIVAIVSEGQKNRTVVASFESPHAPGAPERPGIVMERPVPWPVYALGGVAVVGGVGFAYFGLKGKSQYSSDQAKCGTFCAKSEGDSVNTSFRIADVSVGIGAAALGAGLVWFLARPERPLPHASQVTVNIKAALGGAILEGEF